MTTNEYNRAVDQYADRLYRFVLKSIRNQHTAEDIVQDCYEKLWKNSSNVDSKKVKSYLFTSAYHTLIDYIRKENRRACPEDVYRTEGSYENGYSDLSDLLKEALGRLPEKQRMVLLLRDYEGYTYHEIGEMTQLNESQVKVYIYRARVFLKNYIGKIETVI